MSEPTRHPFVQGVLLAVATFVLVLTAGTQRAYAGPAVCNNSPNSTQQCSYFQIAVGDAWDNGIYTGPYVNGYVELLAGNRIDVHLQSDTQVIAGTTYEYEFGDLFLNVADYPTAGVSVAMSGVTFTGGNNQTGYSLGVPAGGAQGVFGVFDSGADDHNGFNASVTSLNFILTATGANSANFWTDARDVLTNNTNGFSAEAHVYVAISMNPLLTNAGDTGFAGYHRLPEPKPLALLGVSLIGLAMLRRRHCGKI